MNKIKKTVLAAIAAGCVLLPGLTACSSNDDFNGWVAGCMADGGHVALTHKGEWSDRYECFKADKIIVVPGYSGE